MSKTNEQLSKWWKTPSAQAAFKRAADARRLKIEALRAAVAARKAQLKREAEEWEVVS